MLRLLTFFQTMTKSEHIYFIFSINFHLLNLYYHLYFTYLFDIFKFIDI